MSLTCPHIPADNGETCEVDQRRACSPRPLPGAPQSAQVYNTTKEDQGVAQTVAHWLGVRQARVRISALQPRAPAPPGGSYEDNKRVLDE